MMQTQQIRNKFNELVSKPWMPYVWLALITLFGAALRFYKLGAWSFWIDEIHTINHALAHFSTPQLILENIPPSRNWFPVSVMLTAQVLNIWGVSEWSARLTSTFIGILSIPILFGPAKKIFGGRVSLIAVLLLAITPWHIFWSQNARFYSSLMLFYSLALFAFYFGVEKDEPKYLFLFFVLVYFAASERLTGLLIFPVVVIYLVLLWILKFEKPKGMNVRNLLIIALPLMLGGLIELYSRIMKGESRFFADFAWFSQYQIDDPFRLVVFISNNLGVPLMIMAIFSGLFLIGIKSRSGLLMVTSSMVPLILLILLSPYIFTKDRYVFVTLFCWLLLATIGIHEIASRLKGEFMWLAWSVFLVFFVHAMNDMVLYYHANHGNRLQWKSAFLLVKESATDEDVVVAFWPEFGKYYLDREITAYVDTNVNLVRHDDKRYWFVLDSETIWLNGEVKSWLEDKAELVNVWYLRRPEDNYLRVYLFDPTIPGSP